MYKGVIPFILLQLLTLAIVMIFPQTVLWLPSRVLGF
jgi:TRAP-type mannitol/chloroaromatic compound transport system permease large subunit